MAETEVNVPLLRKAVEWAEAEAAKPPELCEWEQNWWSLSVQVREQRRYYDDLTPEEQRAFNKAPTCGTCYCIAGYVAAQAGARVAGWGMEDIATDLLGLDFDAARRLFYSHNTIEDVRRIAEEIAGERL